MQPHEAIIGLYDRLALAWTQDRGRDSRLERRWLDRFTAELTPGADILDIGCGSGDLVGRYLMDSGFSVTGVDGSPALIEIADQELPSAEWIVGDMRTLALGRRFDGLLAWHSLFHLHPEAQRAMFPRFAAHARPGAMLMFTSGPQAGEILGEWRGNPLYSASLSPEEYRELLEANGFNLLAFTPEDAETGGATVWLAQMRPASGLDGSA